MPIRAHIIPRRLTRFDSVSIQKSIDKAPNYGTRVADALSHTIRAIHGLSDFHKALKLEHIEVYIGKSVDTPDAVYNRWSAHGKTKGHLFGMVLFKCTKERAKVLEKVGIRILAKLASKKRLCVGNANIAEGSQGRNATAEGYLVYMTWTVMNTPQYFLKPNKKIIEEVAGAVSDSMEESVTKSQIETGLSAIKRLTDRQRIKIEDFRT